MTAAQDSRAQFEEYWADLLRYYMAGGFGYAKEFAKKEWNRRAALSAEPAAVPQFDAMAPEQEALAVQFCNEIAGPLGKPSSPPDPVRLLEMAEALYNAEMNAG